MAERAQRAVRDRVSPSSARLTPAHGVGVRERKWLDELQRARIVAAMVDVAAEHGAGRMSVALVVARSGVSRRTFYDYFTDLEDCFRAALECTLSLATERVFSAIGDTKSWRERVREGLTALLALLDEQPRLGRMLVDESSAVGPRVLECREQTRAQLVRTIEQGREESKDASGLPSFTGEGVLGGALTVIRARLAETEREQLIELTNPLMSMIVLPYLGAAAARRELSRPVNAPVRSEQNGALLSDPFRDTPIRLTYRTVRVLLAIAEHPDASNRQAGDLAGISDQGQVSKLMHRLQRLGLIENTGLDAGKGMPNAWRLTRKGSEVHGAIAEQSMWT